MYAIWNDEYLGLEIAVDTETTVVPFTETPELVTFQVFNGISAYYVSLDRVPAFFAKHPSSIFIFHNIAFDWDVIEQNCNMSLHSILEEDRFRDTMILYKLVHLAVEGFVAPMASLKHVAKELLQVELEKDDAIRMTFDQFAGMDIRDIPEAHLKYGINDVIVTYQCYERIMQIVAGLGSETRLSEQIQISGSVALNHIYKRGIGFDLCRAKAKLDELNVELEKKIDILATYGWVRGVKGTKERFDELIKYFNLDVPKTESGNFSSAEDDLVQYSDNHFVSTYLEYINLEKMSTFIRDINLERLNPRYNFLVNTGRTSCSGPNFQQLPRKGGIRELFIPKKDHVFLITDYSAIELCTLAQVTYNRFGHSRMRELINQERDLHKYAASQIYGIEESEVTKDQRQLAKILNFGLGANMSPATFVNYAASFGVKLTLEECTKLKRKWVSIYPEMALYFDVHNTDICITETGRIKAKCTYTSYLNTPFQGLAADGAKIALYYLDCAKIPVVGFVHDEVVSEVPETVAKELLLEQERIMVEAMSVVVPDVKIRVESQISKHYCK